MKVGKVTSFAIVASVVFAWAGACTTSTPEGDSESHFLATCPPGCPSGLECICGVCTRTCTTDSTCGSLGTNVTCVEHPTCGTPRTCDRSRRDGGSGGDGGDGSPSDVSSMPPNDGYVPPRGDAGPLPRCDQSVDVRLCEFGELFVHDPQTNTCRSVGGSVCPNNENGFSSLAECLTACPDAGPGLPPPRILTWDGQPFAVDGGLVTCWFPGTLSWSHDDAPGETHTLAYPNYSRTSAAGKTCTAPMPDCDEEGITANEVGIRLRHLHVLTALIAGGGTFGTQDGTGTLITIDGIDLHVGTTCLGSPSRCTDRLGIALLRDILREVEWQELGRGTCAPSPDCFLPVDRGSCAGAIPRFAYDPDTGACKEFAYGGCDGNGNRFETQLACEEACSLDPCGSAPVIPPGSGACEGTIVPTVPERCALDGKAACACACSKTGRATTQCTTLVGPDSRVDCQ